MTLIEFIDRIRELRADADKIEAGISYDPEGYERGQAKRIRVEADALEKMMHSVICWPEGDAERVAKAARKFREDKDREALEG